MKRNLLGIITLCIFLFTLAVTASAEVTQADKLQRSPWLFAGGHVGYINTTTEIPTESDKGGFFADLKAEVDWYFESFIAGVGTGFFYSHISGDNLDFQVGESKVDTWSFFLDGNVAYRLSDQWQLGPIFTAYLSAEDVSFSEEDPAPDSAEVKKTSMFVGLRLAHDMSLTNNILRLTGKALVDIDIGDRTVWYVAVGIHYGWGLRSKAREEMNREPIPEQNVANPYARYAEEPLAQVVQKNTIRVRFGETYLRFKTDSAQLSQYGKKVIKALSDYLLANSDKYNRLLVAGHTDERNTEAYNMALSRRRAKSVASEFVSNGVPRERIRMKGYGESKPIYKESTPEAWAVNRRVEVFISGVENEQGVANEINQLQL